MSFYLASDIHLHPWSAFSHINEKGVNNRLQMIADELLRVGEMAHNEGAPLVIAGDIVHTRGNISTEVANVMMETFDAIKCPVWAIPGNHDLSGREATWSSSILSVLKSAGVHCVNEPTYVHSLNLMLVPWIENKGKLKQVLIEAAEQYPGCDVVMHTHLNSVIKGIPDTGFDPSELGRIGFKRVFSGHLHNHVDFGNGVYSIGALTHQTWSDVGTKAGFMYVSDKATLHVESQTPKFVDVDPSDEDVIVGQYARAKIDANTPADTKAFRQHLLDLGAMDAIVTAKPKDNQQRSQTSINAGASINTSISEWIKKKEYQNPQALEMMCNSILEEADEC